jgi:hypothetical protein
MGIECTDDELDQASRRIGVELCGHPGTRYYPLHRDGVRG